MNTHELAEKLLKLPDMTISVAFHTWEDGQVEFDELKFFTDIHHLVIYSSDCVPHHDELSIDELLAK